MARIKAYENKELFIIFLPVLIFSSSPKLNFFIKTPEPTATAAAAVERARSSCEDGTHRVPFHTPPRGTGLSPAGL